MRDLGETQEDTETQEQDHNHHLHPCAASMMLQTEDIVQRTLQTNKLTTCNRISPSPSGTHMLLVQCSTAH